MFKLSYQDGPFVAVFNPSGPKPCKAWTMSGQIARNYDKPSAGLALFLTGGPSTKMQLPIDRRDSLSLTQRFLCLQVCLPSDRSFALELGVTTGDNSTTRRRLVLSTSFKGTKLSPLNSQFPLRPQRHVVGGWQTLVLDLSRLVDFGFPNTGGFSSLDSISLTADCKLRKIFTLRRRPLSTVNFGAAEDECNDEDDDDVDPSIPAAVDFPPASRPRPSVAIVGTGRPDEWASSPDDAPEQQQRAPANDARKKGIDVAFGYRADQGVRGLPRPPLPAAAAVASFAMQPTAPPLPPSPPRPPVAAARKKAASAAAAVVPPSPGGGRASSCAAVSSAAVSFKGAGTPGKGSPPGARGIVSPSPRKLVVANDEARQKDEKRIGTAGAPPAGSPAVRTNRRAEDVPQQQQQQQQQHAEMYAWASPGRRAQEQDEDEASSVMEPYDDDEASSQYDDENGYSFNVPSSARSAAASRNEQRDVLGELDVSGLVKGFYRKYEEEEGEEEEEEEEEEEREGEEEEEHEEDKDEDEDEDEDAAGTSFASAPPSSSACSASSPGWKSRAVYPAPHSSSISNSIRSSGVRVPSSPDASLRSSVSELDASASFADARFAMPSPPKHAPLSGPETDGDDDCEDQESSSPSPPPPHPVAGPSLSSTLDVGMSELLALQRELEALEQSYELDYVGLGGGGEGGGKEEAEDGEGNQEHEFGKDVGDEGEVLLATGMYGCGDHEDELGKDGEEDDVVVQLSGGEEEEEEEEEEDEEEELELVMIRPGCYQCPRTKKFYMLKEDDM